MYKCVKPRKRWSNVSRFYYISGIHSVLSQLGGSYTFFSYVFPLRWFLPGDLSGRWSCTRGPSSLAKRINAAANWSPVERHPKRSSGGPMAPGRRRVGSYHGDGDGILWLFLWKPKVQYSSMVVTWGLFLRFLNHMIRTPHFYLKTCHWLLLTTIDSFLISDVIHLDDQNVVN